MAHVSPSDAAVGQAARDRGSAAPPHGASPVEGPVGGASPAAGADPEGGTAAAAAAHAAPRPPLGAPQGSFSLRVGIVRHGSAAAAASAAASPSGSHGPRGLQSVESAQTLWVMGDAGGELEDAPDGADDGEGGGASHEGSADKKHTPNEEDRGVVQEALRTLSMLSAKGSARGLTGDLVVEGNVQSVFRGADGSPTTAAINEEATFSGIPGLIRVISEGGPASDSPLPHIAAATEPVDTTSSAQPAGSPAASAADGGSGSRPQTANTTPSTAHGTTPPMAAEGASAPPGLEHGDSLFNVVDGPRRMSDPGWLFFKAAVVHIFKLQYIALGIALAAFPVLLLQNWCHNTYLNWWVSTGANVTVHTDHVMRPAVFHENRGLYFVFASWSTTGSLLSALSMPAAWLVVMADFKVPRSLKVVVFVYVAFFVSYTFAIFWEASSGTLIPHNVYGAAGFGVSLILGVTAGVVMRGQLKFSGLLWVLIPQTVVYAGCIFSYHVIVPGWFLAPGVKVSTLLLIRLVVHPAIMETLQTIMRISSLAYPATVVKSSKLIVFLAPGFAMMNFMGRFLVASMPNLGGVVGLSLALAAQNLLLRLSMDVRDYCVMRLCCMGRSRSKKSIYSRRRRRMKADMLTLEVVAETFGILAGTFTVLLYQVRFQGTESLVNFLLSSAFQVAIAIGGDLVPPTIVFMGRTKFGDNTPRRVVLDGTTFAPGQAKQKRLFVEALAVQSTPHKQGQALGASAFMFGDSMHTPAAQNAPQREAGASDGLSGEVRAGIAERPGIESAQHDTKPGAAAEPSNREAREEQARQELTDEVLDAIRQTDAASAAEGAPIEIAHSSSNRSVASDVVFGTCHDCSGHYIARRLYLKLSRSQVNFLNSWHSMFPHYTAVLVFYLMTWMCYFARVFFFPGGSMCAVPATDVVGSSWLLRWSYVPCIHH